jgi:hypothetical protein
MYYGIYKDEIKYQVVSIEEQEFAKNNSSMYLYFVKRTEYETGMSNYGFIYEIYDNKLNRTSIEINGWKTSSLFKTFSAWATVTKYITDLEIIDTEGKIQTISRLENSLEVVVQFLLNISSYKTWANYNLYKEIEELKAQIIQLNSQINQLQISQTNNAELLAENLRLKEELTTLKSIETENKELKHKLSAISSIIFSGLKENDIATN